MLTISWRSLLCALTARAHSIFLLRTKVASSSARLSARRSFVPLTVQFAHPNLMRMLNYLAFVGPSQRPLITFRVPHSLSSTSSHTTALLHCLNCLSENRGDKTKDATALLELGERALRKALELCLVYPRGSPDARARARRDTSKTIFTSA